MEPLAAPPIGVSHPKNAPDWLRSVSYHPRTSARLIQLSVIDEAAGLIWLANQGGIEFHPWAARLHVLTEPDQAIFDLDLGGEATFTDVLVAALRLREALQRLELAYPRNPSGGRGLHVYLPLAPSHALASARVWVRTLAQQFAAAFPDLIAVARASTHRRRLVTIDHAQHGIGRNTAAPYTLRAQLPRACVGVAQLGGGRGWSSAPNRPDTTHGS